MAKAVLLSIRPEWVAKICSGEKTLEVRKNKPRLETPFRCYIYCSMPNTNDPHKVLEIHGTDGKIRRGNGKVIGEFICDKVECVDIPYPAFQGKLDKRYTEQSCVRYYDLHRYVYHDAAYFWHISDLEIYNQPKELSEFMRPCPTDLFCEVCAMYREFDFQCCNAALKIKRPPRSWCYVEEL